MLSIIITFQNFRQLFFRQNGIRRMGLDEMGINLTEVTIQTLCPSLHPPYQPTFHADSEVEVSADQVLDNIKTKVWTITCMACTILLYRRYATYDLHYIVWIPNLVLLVEVYTCSNMISRSDWKTALTSQWLGWIIIIIGTLSILDDKLFEALPRGGIHWWCIQPSAFRSK